MCSKHSQSIGRHAATGLLLVWMGAAPAFAQALKPAPPPDYVVGPQDVLAITSYDQADLTGKFTVETDGTFTYPMIGRFRAGSLTLRGVEDALKERLMKMVRERKQGGSGKL